MLRGEIIKQAAWATHPANPFPPADKHHLPWNYHRVLTMRDNPLAAPQDWLSPEHAALDVSAYDWFRSLGLDDAAVAIAYGMNASFGRDAHDVSALLLLFRGAFSKSQRTHAPSASIGYTARRGVQRIPEAMAEALRGGVELGCEVTGISPEADRRAATLHEWAAVRGTARDLPRCRWPRCASFAIDPPLRGAPAHGPFAELPAQPLTQLYLVPNSRFWERDGFAASLFTDPAAGMVAAARNGEDPTEVTSLTAWVMGEAANALDRLAPADAGRAVIAAIEQMRPAAAGSSSSSACTRGAQILMPAAHGPIFDRGKSPASRRSWVCRMAGFGSAASTSQSRAAAWKARWNRASARPRTCSPAAEQPADLMRFCYSGIRT